MELEQLKDSWTALDDRLKRNESLTESLIIKMTQKSAKKSINKLLLWEIYNIVITVLVIPIIVYAYYKLWNKFISLDILIICTSVSLVVCPIWYIYKICILKKIDFSKKISDNIYNTNLFNILITREKNVSMVAIPIMIILMILTYAEIKVGTDHWILLSCSLLFATAVTYWSYWRFYKRNIQSILESLNEIREIEERD